MPCRDDRDNIPHDNSKELKTIENLKKIVNIQDTMLCAACRVLEKYGFDFDENPRLSEWWDEHKKDDMKKEKDATWKRLRHELAVEASKKPVGQLTREDKILLKEEGFL